MASVHVAGGFMNSALLILCMTSLEGTFFVFIACCKLFNTFEVRLNCFSPLFTVNSLMIL